MTVQLADLAKCQHMGFVSASVLSLPSAVRGINKLMHSLAPLCLMLAQLTPPLATERYMYTYTLCIYTAIYLYT